MVKRLFDILMSLMALIVLAPFFIPIAIALRFTGEGEVFYLQERIGLGRKGFKIIKFATMLKDSPNIGSGDITVKDDPRVLPLGGFLRKSKINEIPQLINVLNGTMSVIGPRPTTLGMFEMFPEDYKSVFETIKPGLSGIGSVAFRDEESLLTEAENSEQCYREKIIPFKSELERWYRDHIGLWTDLKIIALTVIVIVRPGMDPSRRFFSDLPENTM